MPEDDLAMQLDLRKQRHIVDLLVQGTADARRSGLVKTEPPKPDLNGEQEAGLSTAYLTKVVPGASSG